MQVRPANSLSLFAAPWAVGDVEIDKEVVTPEAIQSIAKAAAKIDVEDGPTAREWKQIADRVTKSGGLDEDDLKLVGDFAKKVRARHKELHRQYRESGYSDKAVNKELENTHIFLQEFEAPRRHYLEQAAKANVQALAGASFGPIGAVSAYVTYAGLTQAGTEELVGQLEGLAKDQSPLVYSGNDVKPVHQERLWQAKHKILEGALQSARNGKPVEVDVQYFELTSDEIVGRLAELARAGCPVRVNVDPSRLQAGGLSGTSVDDAPRKLRAILQLASLEGADVGVSIYPIQKQLGSFSELMHRKLVRVGDEVLLGGMNANEGSGENVDAGYLISGPAAQALVKGFARDLKDSSGVGADEIYGEKQIEKFMESDMALSPQGLATLFDVYAGPAPAGTPVPEVHTGDELKALAEKAGFQLNKLIDMPKKELEASLEDAVSSGTLLPLSKAGKKALSDLVQRAVEAANEPDNVERLSRVSLPKAEAAGSTRVGVGDLPAEREALLLHGIARAEKFVYIPTFVITRAVAAALAARRDEMKAQGKDLDVRVIADPGIYPYGGTPNEFGVLELEDKGIPIRWAMLPRSTRDHDRKIHAKQMITDKNEFFGSTNLSKKGMRDNWELSGLMYFDEGNAQAEAAREDGKNRFLKLWDHESFELNTRQVAERRLANVQTKDREMRINEARSSVVRQILFGVQRFEQETADWLQGQWESNPALAGRADALHKEGMAWGYALLRAAEEVLGTEAFYQGLNSLPSRQALEALKTS